MKSITAKLALASTVALFASLSATQAATYTWVPSTGGTWDTVTANWNDGVTNPTTWVDGSGNSVVFNGFAAIATVTQSANWTLSSLTLNSTGGTSTLTINGGKSLNIPAINTTGDSSIDMYSKITGSHGLTFNATSTSTNGRLNLKTANDYTGDTFLTGKAYITTAINNALPTGTTLNMVTGTTFRFATNNVTQAIAGLVGTGGTVNATSTGNTLTINTKSATTTTYSGNITSTTGLNLVISGSGTQAINGTNSFTGSTTVSGGTLSLGSNLTGSSSVTVSGGTLTSSVANVNLGLGAVSMSAGEISARGTGTVGSFTVAANKIFSTTGGTLTFDLDSTSSFDKIIGSGTGTFSISGTTLALNLLTWSASDYENTYAIFSGFSGGSISGLTITGYDTANWVAALSNSGVLSFSAAAVPEPSAFAALAGLGALALASTRRRRASRA